MMGNHVDILWSDKFEIHEKWQLLLVKRKTCVRFKLSDNRFRGFCFSV